MDFYKRIAAMKDDMIRTTRELVQIKSIQDEPVGDKPYGEAMDEALDYVLDLADSMGFVTKKIDGYCGYIEYGEGDMYIGVFGHVDVNNEDDEDWKYDPYSGYIEKNRIYGCCITDKSALIASLFALKAVKDSGTRLNRKVRIIVGTDERRTFSDLDSYLNCEAPPMAGFTTDGHFPVTFAEKALAMFEFRYKVAQSSDEYIEYIRGGKLDNLVPGYCSAKLVTPRRREVLDKLVQYTEEYRRDISAKMLDDGLFIEAFGSQRHCASIEKGINSIVIMVDFLRYLNFGSDDFRHVVDTLCRLIGFDIYGESLGISYEDEFSGKTALNFGILNMADDELTIRLDCRFPITANYVQSIETVNSSFGKEGFENVECSYWVPTYMPQNHFLIKALLESYREVTGDDSEPISSSSSSYSKVIPNIAAYGAHYPGETIAWDQNDEYIEIDTLEKTARIYASAIHRLCTEI